VEVMQARLADGEEKTVRVIWAFVALAVVAGPVRTLAYNTFGFVWVWPAPGGGVATALLAGFVLLLIGLARRERMLAGKQVLALAVLLLPQCAAVVLNPPLGMTTPWLRDTPWGAAFLLSVAAPLWLGLLSALDLIPVEVPRVTVGAGIAGVGAICLTIPTDAYRVAPHQTVALMIHLLVGILVVLTWAYARPILAGAGIFATAGSFLVLSALRDAGLGLLTRQRPWTPPDWRAAAVPLLVEAMVSAVLWSLWFWLLERMTLAAFSMGSLAMWTAGIIPGFVLFGFRNWRVNVALAIAVGAIVVALRARVVDEQPTALGLGGT
jgi:hypothetical protein